MSGIERAQSQNDAVNDGVCCLYAQLASFPFVLCVSQFDF